MTLRRLLIVSAAVLMLTGMVTAQANKSPEARLRAAMDKETVDGDLKAAIDGYKQIISQKDASREVVAQALLRLGMAYESQGNAEARKRYEQLVRDYSDQAAVAEQARVRMAAKSVAGNGPALRQVCSIDCGGSGSISPDGRWLVTYNGGLGLREMASTSVIRRLAPAPADGGFDCCDEFSPDGKRIVYQHRVTKPKPANRAIVVNVDGSGSPVQFEDRAAFAWSPDGARLLVASQSDSQTEPAQLSWVRLSDGAAQPLPTIKYQFEIAKISPDGRYVAFNATKGRGAPENIYLMAADGSGETPISPSPFHQDPAGWSADGKYLVYWQGEALWMVAVANGRVQAAPLKIRDLGPSGFINMSSGGTVYYRHRDASTGVAYTASMDPASGRVTSVPVVLPISKFGSPAVWSPDGRRIAFLSAGPDSELHVFSLEDGKDQRVPARASFDDGLCWPSDDNAVLANTSASRIAIGQPVRVDVTSGDMRPVFREPSDLRLRDCTQTIAATSNQNVVKVRDLTSGAETELYRKHPGGNAPRSKISPDSRFVVFFDTVDANTNALMLVTSAGGAARELMRVTTPSQFMGLAASAWSPDSRFVYFFKRADSRSPYRLFRVSITGGPEEYMGLELMDVAGMAIAPDSKQVLLNIEPPQRVEIWALDNFLPSGK